MLPPWAAEERRRQESLRKAIEALGYGDGRKVGDFPDPLAPAGPWTFAALVGWWLKAGDALHRISEAGRRDLAGRVGRGPGEGLYPPLWIAARCTAWHLASEGLPRQLAESKAWAATNRAYEQYLYQVLTWLVNWERPRPSAPDPKKNPRGWLASLEQEFTNLVKAVTELLGDRYSLEYGADLSYETSDDWQQVPLAERRPDGTMWRVRRPVVGVVGEQRSRFIIPGLVVLQYPGTLVQQAARSVTIGAAASSVAQADPGDRIKRVLGVTAERWQGIQRPSKAVQDVWQRQSFNADFVDRVFLPLLRLLVLAAAESRNTVSFRDENAGDDAAKVSELLQDVRLSLALDKCVVRSGEPPTAGGDRMIPHRGVPGAGQEFLSFHCKAAGKDVPVGWLGAPAACDEALLAAIEAVDWRLWAFQHVPADERAADVVALIVKAAKPASWEPLKRRALLEPADADAVGALVDFVHTRRLALELLRSLLAGKAAAGLPLEAFIEEYGCLERAAFERLLVLDPGAPARLDPPRRADGFVDVPAWVARRGRAAAKGPEWRLEWVRDERPAGSIVDERRVGAAYVVRVSAGAIADEDLAILKLEPVPPLEGKAEAPGTLSRTLAELQSAVAAEFAKGAPVVDLGVGLAALRRVLAADRAAAFHELIERWRRGEEEAAAWARLLAADKRFSFSCHPAIDPASGVVAVAAADDPYLAWAFDDRVPAGADVAITFALEPGRARRVISRGPRARGSPADRAEALVAAAGPDGGLSPLAADALQATDRWSHFPSYAPHPREAARRLLDALLDEGSAPADVRAATFAAAAQWCAALGLEVVPASWSPDGSVPQEAIAGEDPRYEFNDAVPTGSVIVRGFGLRGPDGVPFAGAISAGPASPGFAAMEAAARAVAGAGPAWTTIIQRVDDLPKHAVSGTLALAGSNLFDALWQAAAADVPHGLADSIDALKSGLIGFLKDACRMLPFEPSNMGDYPTAWIRESDGRQPKGRRIRRVVRPGLRTLDNTLVRPALVVTE